MMTNGALGHGVFISSVLLFSVLDTVSYISCLVQGDIKKTLHRAHLDNNEKF